MTILDGTVNRRRALALGGSVAATLVGLDASTAVAGAQEQAAPGQQGAIDQKAIERALGTTGQMMPGGVFRVSLPRTDLHVTVQGVPLKPAFALGSYAAFVQAGGAAMVMGDLVLLDTEVNAVMSGLFQGGLSVTALHNHLLEMSPHVMYLHYLGHGDAAHLATALRRALAASGTPFRQTSAKPAMGTLPIDTTRIGAILGHAGTIKGGVLQVSIPRSETITERGMVLLPALGVTTAFNFQPTGAGMAAITGDFVLLASEVNPVARTLHGHAIAVTAIHNHALADEPRLFYMHFWAHDDAVRLAHGLRAALDHTHHR
jgi:hypothetical protein